MQGVGTNRPPGEQIVGNDTMFFIKPADVPAGRKVTYATHVCTMRPGKSEKYRVRMAVGGDRLDAYQDVRSPAVGVTDTKLHINSVISDAARGARYCTCDIKDFFLGSAMPVYQYMKIHRRYLTPEIIQEYSLTEDYFDANGYCFLEIRKGMYGLKEAAILAYEQLCAHLAPYGYHPVTHTPGLWRHTERPTTFTLAVDDFGIKFFCKADAEHLFDALSAKYTITKDWSGTSYLGFTIRWNYAAGHLHAGLRAKGLAHSASPLPRKASTLATPLDCPGVWSKNSAGQCGPLASSGPSRHQTGPANFGTFSLLCPQLRSHHYCRPERDLQQPGISH
jgi:hypothetical protein